MKKLLRSTLALLCCASLLLGTFGGELSAVFATESTTALEDYAKEFTMVTPREFGIDDFTSNPDLTKHRNTEQPISQRNKVKFSANLHFDSTRAETLRYMGGDLDNQWQRGLTFEVSTSMGMVRLYDRITCEGFYIEDTYDASASKKSYVDFKGIMNQDIEFSITTEVINYDGGTEADDLKIGVWINGILYNDQFLYMVGVTESIFYEFYNLEVATTSCSSPEIPTEKLPTDFAMVTPRDYNLQYTLYEGTGMSDEYNERTGNATRSSMHQVRFDTMITLGTGTQFIYMGSASNAWAGLQFNIQSDGSIKLWNFISGSDEKVWMGDTGNASLRLDPSIALGDDVTAFIDEPFKLSITTEYVAFDGDELNDIKLGVWFNEKLYDEKFFYITDCATAVESTIKLVRYTGNIVLGNTSPLEPVETSETYNLSDGAYLVIGNGTITVNGEEVPNGTTLTEPGTYEIISEDGRITRNVTLTKTGSTSTAITYEDGVMPIIGYHGPYSYKDSRGTKHDTISDTTYKLLSEAGFNMISKIAMNWNEEDNRAALEESLEYAEKYGLGMYIWDAGLRDKTTATDIAAQIAQYSDYESFKGIYVVDEPRTDNYAVDNTDNSHLYAYTDMATSINQYCNLNAYINLFPDLKNEGEDFAAYVEEYLSATKGRYISYDYYAFGETYVPSTSNFYSSNVADYFAQLSTVREKALENGIPFWPFVQVGNHWNVSKNEAGFTTPENDSLTRAQLLWNVNTSLAYGAKGIQYFPMVQPDYFAYAEDNTYDYQRNGVLGADGEKTEWYPFVAEANEQIAVVDEYLLAATSQAILAKGTAAEETTGISTEEYGRLATIDVSDENNGAVVGAFDYKGSDMFYVVNYDMAGTTADTITLNFKETHGFRLIQGDVTSYVEGKSCELTIPAGEAVLVIVEEAAGSDDMTRLTPENFGLEYKEYVKADTANGEWGETSGSCSEITSMDNVMFKTNVTMGSGAVLRYMRSGASESSYCYYGVSFRTNTSGSLIFENYLTEDSTFFIGDNMDPQEFCSFNPGEAMSNDATSWLDIPFDLTLTTEFVAYDEGEENDLKLGIYFNDTLYRDTYIYIKDCKDACYPGMYLYRPSAPMSLAKPVVFETELQPEITDSIAMTYRTFLVDEAAEAPTLTFDKNGTDLVVTGTKKSDKIWEFTYPDVYVQNMAETVTATLKVSDYTKTYKTSMLDYSAYVLNMEADAQELKNLIVDLVQYGAGVQQYNGVAADSEELLTTKLEVLVPDYKTYDLSDETSFEGLEIVEKTERLTGTSTDTTYTWKSASLVLGNKVKIRYRFAATSVENLTVKATINNKAYVLEPKQEGEGIWFVDFDSIYAYEYDEPISVSFYEDGKQVGKTVNYSVNTYLNSMQSYAEANESTWSNLLFAIHNYGTAAKSYQSVK